MRDNDIGRECLLDRSQTMRRLFSVFKAKQKLQLNVTNETIVSMAKKLEEFSEARGKASDEVVRYIRKHPSVKDCLKRGLLNLSAVARVITEESSTKFKHERAAVVMALRRLRRRVSERSNEDSLMRVIRSARLSTESGLGAIILDRTSLDRIIFNRGIRNYQQRAQTKNKTFDLIELANVAVVFCAEDDVVQMKREFPAAVIKSHTALSMVQLHFGPQIETTVGVTSYVYATLAEHGINIVEEVSCWDKIVMMVREVDLSRTIEALQGQRY